MGVVIKVTNKKVGTVPLENPRVYIRSKLGEANTATLDAFASRIMHYNADATEGVRATAAAAVGALFLLLWLHRFSCTRTRIIQGGGGRNGPTVFHHCYVWVVGRGD